MHLLAANIQVILDTEIAPLKAEIERLREMTKIFQYHTRYTFDQIAQIASPHYPTRPGLIAGLPNHVAVIGPEGEQYDFCGVDDRNLVLVWIDGPPEGGAVAS